ncbi:hypothetical protein IG631_03572 [Alternaria alternata]|nr:hypothetical protein IG631_03572 [Alternaria alternata]
MACGRGAEWEKPRASRPASDGSLVRGSCYTIYCSIPHQIAYSLHEISTVSTVLAMIAGPDPRPGMAMVISS